MSVLIPREVAGRFRSAARKCLSNRKGPDPPVLVESGDGRLTLYSWLDEVGLALTVPAPPGRDDQAVVPLEGGAWRAAASLRFGLRRHAPHPSNSDGLS